MIIKWLFSFCEKTKIKVIHYILDLYAMVEFEKELV